MDYSRLYAELALPGKEMNPGLSPVVREQLKEKFHFDKPLHKQYWLMMRDMFSGRLTSFKDNRPAIDKVMERMPATLALTLMAFLISYSCSIPLGIYAARHKGGFRDRFVGIFSFALISLPTFWIAYMIVVLLVRVWSLPAMGTQTFGVVFPNALTSFMDMTWHVFLPAFTLALGAIAAQSRYMRASMVETMNEEYIRTARAKGLSEAKVAYKHALRNSLRPVVTFIGYLLPGLLGGSVIIEQIFGYPGMGRLMYEAMMERDMPVIMVEITIASALVLLGNLIADILYAVVDPRVRPN